MKNNALFFWMPQPQAEAKVNGTTVSSPSTSLQRSDSSQPMLLRVVGSQTSESMGKCLSELLLDFVLS